MTTFIVLRVDDDDQADVMLRDMAEFPDHDLLSPCLEHAVHAVPVVATRDGQAYTPAVPPNLTDDELMALQRDLEELERTDPAVRASAEALDATIRRLNIASRVLDEKRRADGYAG